MDSQAVAVPPPALRLSAGRLLVAPPLLSPSGDVQQAVDLGLLARLSQPSALLVHPCLWAGVGCRRLGARLDRGGQVGDQRGRLRLRIADLGDQLVQQRPVGRFRSPGLLRQRPAGLLRLLGFPRFQLGDVARDLGIVLLRDPVVATGAEAVEQTPELPPRQVAAEEVQQVQVPLGVEVSLDGRPVAVDESYEPREFPAFSWVWMGRP